MQEALLRSGAEQWKLPQPQGRAARSMGSKAARQVVQTALKRELRARGCWDSLGTEEVSWLWVDTSGWSWKAQRNPW